MCAGSGVQQASQDGGEIAAAIESVLGLSEAAVGVPIPSYLCESRCTLSTKGHNVK